MESNEVLDRLPAHLLSLVIEQPYNTYTAQDHAVWRYIMRQNVHYLPKVAHGSYLEGLKKTGISIDSIPHMYGMNRILKEIGWAAVAVDGFIPPSAFMEFQAYNVLVIAADIRPITQVGYTPAPDIVHEAAGHAPIIADPEYAAYLIEFGRIGSKAFTSKKDIELYEAIRLLSIVKADPYSTPELIRKAEEGLETIEKSFTTVSELAQIRNLHWWTVEYGLTGDLENPKIYGAGLLSSISESYNCLQDAVKKIPYSVDAARVSFDITTQQPQLFVTPDFPTLMRVLHEYASTMALRTGGVSGLRKAADSGTLATAVYNSGLQVSGIIGSYKEFRGEPAYLQFNSETGLSYNDRQLEGQGKERHGHGFGSPVGKPEGASLPLERMTDGEIDGWTDKNGITTIRFESGVEVKGKVTGISRREGKIILISFADCTVIYEGETLFQPSWGSYDMAVGASITSVFPGPADPAAWGLAYPELKEKTHKIVHTPEQLKLHSLYQAVRDLRDSGKTNGRLEQIWHNIRDNHPDEWLLPLEILELVSRSKHPGIRKGVRNHLAGIKKSGEFAKLVDDGLNLLNLEPRP